MKVLLMHPDRDFNREQTGPANAAQLSQDLEIDVILRTMGAGDELVLDVCRRALFGGLKEVPATALYRQAVLRDALAHPELVRELYKFAHDTIELRRRTYFGIFVRYASSVLSGSVDIMRMLTGRLRGLRDFGRRAAPLMKSDAFSQMFAMIEREVTEPYLAEVSVHLSELKFDGGVLESAQFGPGCAGRNYTLRRRTDRRGRWSTWWHRVLAWLRREPRSAFTFQLAERDESGARILTDLHDRGINEVANALAQSADHVLSFFEQLRAELAFYVGCLNLHEELHGRADIAFAAPSEVRRYAQLRDVSLLLSTKAPVIGNEVDAGRRSLIVVTGANQGGKSSFLRSIGQAQLMMQCGMFVCAAEMAAPWASGVFTHYRREEDTTMRSGKFDEELVRMEAIAQQVEPNALLLFNESFAATNEREGAEVAVGIVAALLEANATVFIVTHMYALASNLQQKYADAVMFLRAPRLPDGSRPFRLIEQQPEETSHGIDLYRTVFSDHVATRHQGVGAGA